MGCGLAWALEGERKENPKSLGALVFTRERHIEGRDTIALPSRTLVRMHWSNTAKPHECPGPLPLAIAPPPHSAHAPSPGLVGGVPLETLD